jgi:hypothetical protein
MKIRYLIIFLIMGIFIGEAQAMSPKKGGAAAASDLAISGTKCGGKKIAAVECSFSPSSGSDYALIGACDTKKEPIEIKAGSEIVGYLGVKTDLYQGITGTPLNSEFCINITTALNASKEDGGVRRIPKPGNPLTLKVFIFTNKDKTTPPIHSESITIKIDKSRLKETLDAEGLKNTYTVSFKLPPGLFIARLNFSLLPMVTGDFLKTPFP